MRLLLDTCTFLWITLGSPELSTRSRDLFSDPDNEAYLSAVSVWEIAVKHQLNRLPLPSSPSRFVVLERERHLISPLPLTEMDAAHLEKLPEHHRDPFDRMLICQAIENGLTLLTPDPLIRDYPIKTEW